MIAGGVPLGLLLLLVAGWGIDSAVSGDRAARNVVVSDLSVSAHGGAEGIYAAAWAVDVSPTLRAAFFDDTLVVAPELTVGEGQSAAIDGDGRPKPLWYATRAFFRPKLITIRPTNNSEVILPVRPAENVSICLVSLWTRILS